MDIIQHQADEFLNHFAYKNNNSTYFINQTNEALLNYKLAIQKVIFLEKVFALIKTKYDRHLQHCNEHRTGNCRFGYYYESILFFLQHEVEFYEKRISSNTFKTSERLSINRNINDMIESFKQMETCHFEHFLAFKAELTVMKHYYYLDKKSWKQLFIGKLSELVSNKIISRNSAKQLIKQMDEAYQFQVTEPIKI